MNMLAQLNVDTVTVVATVIVTAIGILGGIVTMLVKQGRTEEKIAALTEKVNESNNDHKNLWSSYGKHEQRLDTHETFLTKILDKMEIKTD